MSTKSSWTRVRFGEVVKLNKDRIADPVADRIAPIETKDFRNHKRRHLVKIILMLTSFVSILAACTSPPPSPLPEGNVSDIKNVRVSRPDPAEMDQLTTLSRLPEGACTSTKDGKDCTIDANQALKWGWGFCKNSEAALQSAVKKAQVELIVDGVKIPGDLIYQHDDVYDRKVTPYCHTWLIKLSDWNAGSKVKLESRHYVPGVIGPKTNVFVVTVKEPK